MVSTIHTKYNIGQEVYLKKTALDFSRGYFIDVEVPDPTPYIVTSIRVHMYPDYVSVYYRLDGKQESIREDKVFSSLAEVVENCKHDSE